MPDTPRPADPAVATITDFDAANPLRSDPAGRRGITRRGKACELVDNSTDRLSVPELREILAALVREKRFGFAPASEAGA